MLKYGHAKGKNDNSQGKGYKWDGSIKSKSFNE